MKKLSKKSKRMWFSQIGWWSFLILYSYSSSFTFFHGFNKFTRFIDYHLTDYFRVLAFCFFGLVICYFYIKGKTEKSKYIGYYSAILVTSCAIATEYMEIWKIGKFTKTGDIVDVFMYILGGMTFCIIYYIFNKSITKKSS